MELLPFELIDMTIGFLDTREALLMYQLNKSFYKNFNEDFFYKNRLLNEYQISDHFDTLSLTKKWRKTKEYNKVSLTDSELQCITNWRLNKKEFYKVLLKCVCIGCLNITTHYHGILKKQVCMDCCKNTKRYKTITMTEAMGVFSLTRKEINSIRYYTSTNYIDINRPIKLFLESDVKKKHLLKFPRNEDYINYITKKSQNKTAHVMKCFFKKTILLEILRDYYNINLTQYETLVNKYYNGLYTRYIQNIGVQDDLLLEHTINAFLEIDFIKMVSGVNYTENLHKIYNTEVYSRTLFQYILVNKFDAFIYHCLVTDKFTDQYTIHNYIQQIINRIGNLIIY